jgi:hypothetical protein
VKDHPEVKDHARHREPSGTSCRPTNWTSLLKLYSKVSNKTLVISKTLGIEGKKLLTPDDDFEALKDFNHAVRRRAHRAREHAPGVPGACWRHTPTCRSGWRPFRAAFSAGKAACRP